MWKLLADDTILDGPRKRLLGLPQTFEPTLDDPELQPGYRRKLALWLTCPWCCGFWLALAWWAAWLLFDHWTLVAAVPWALSALVGLVAKHLG